MGRFTITDNTETVEDPRLASLSPPFWEHRQMCAVSTVYFIDVHATRRCLEMLKHTDAHTAPPSCCVVVVVVVVVVRTSQPDPRGVVTRMPLISLKTH